MRDLDLMIYLQKPFQLYPSQSMILLPITQDNSYAEQFKYMETLPIDLSLQVDLFRAYVNSLWILLLLALGSVST